jgi:hypothetical protein
MSDYMTPNQLEMTIEPKKKNHKGFVDCEGNELEPGDIVAVAGYGNAIRSCIITRFTAKRVYYAYMFLERRCIDNSIKSCEYIDAFQLSSDAPTDWRTQGKDAHRMMHGVLKL